MRRNHHPTSTLEMAAGLSQLGLDQEIVMIPVQVIWLDQEPGPHLRAWPCICNHCSRTILKLQGSGIETLRDIMIHWMKGKRRGRNIPVLNTSRDWLCTMSMFPPEKLTHYSACSWGHWQQLPHNSWTSRFLESHQQSSQPLLLPHLLPHFKNHTISLFPAIKSLASILQAASGCLAESWIRLGVGAKSNFLRVCFCHPKE